MDQNTIERRGWSKDMNDLNAKRTVDELKRDEAALAERLLALIEQRQLARSQPATPATTPAAADCASKINDVDG